MEGDSTPVLTEFNSNLATLQRIDNSLRMAASAQIRDDYVLWFKTLRNIMKEAIVKMKPEQKKQCKDTFKKLQQEMKVFLQSKAPKSFFMVDIDEKLDDFEIFMREIMDKKGMLLKDNEPDLRGI